MRLWHRIRRGHRYQPARLFFVETATDGPWVRLECLRRAYVADAADIQRFVPPKGF